jgi:chromosome segregation ATPase
MINMDNQSLCEHEIDLAKTTYNCDTCHQVICDSCSVIQVSETDQALKICENCYKADQEDIKEKAITELKQKIKSKSELLQSYTLALLDIKNSLKASKSELKDFEACADRRRSKNEKLIKRVMDLDIENSVLENKINKYAQSLDENNDKVNMMTADLDRMKSQHQESFIKISQFQEMIKEQEEENSKLLKDIENARVDFENQQKDIEIKQLDEKQLKKRVTKLQDHIEKVKKENRCLDYHLKVLNDEDKLKSGTISIISEKVSLITGSNLETKQHQSNELSLQMKKQVEEIMKLYKDINTLKIQKKIEKNKKEPVTNSDCKCIIQ